MARAKPIPEGYHALTPYLRVKGASKAIEFYKNAFGAREVMRLADPGGRIGHAELEIGDSRLMISDEFPEMGLLAPHTSEEAPLVIHFYVEDVDSVLRMAVNAGARVVREAKDEFYGDRTCKLVDPFGHYWFVATHKEDVAQDEIEKRYKEFMRQMASSAQHRAS
jgi:PhnB protein